MIRKLKSEQYRLYSPKVDARSGKRMNLGTFTSREKAEQHERAVQNFKHRQLAHHCLTVSSGRRQNQAELFFEKRHYHDVPND
jgi:hypothetical protein